VPSLLGFYHALPTSLRTVAATARGYQLQRWRYSSETDQLVASALDRDYWTQAQWDSWQAERLASMLRRAATNVPYYRGQWDERRRKGDGVSPDVLGNWPILRKEALRQGPRMFLADDVQIHTMHSEHTSGTTGTPIRIWSSRDTASAWYGLFEARWRRWYGITRHDRWANLGGQVVVPVARCRPPFWVWNAAMHQLYMSSYHLAVDLIPYYLDALERYEVKYILGYTSSLYALALAARKRKRGFHVALVLTNAEPLHVHQRELISDVFQCPVRETYGMSEMVVAASECEAGRLHLWPEAGVVEILDWQSDHPVPPGTTGRIVASGLLNSDMPLVRYETGDSGALDPDQTPCVCGRSLPRLLCVEGRCDDTLKTLDGRRVGRLDAVFKASMRVREAQIVQESLNRVVVRVVPLDGYSQADEVLIAARLRERVGNMEVEFEKLDSIPREKNGKFRAVVNHTGNKSGCG